MLCTISLCIFLFDIYIRCNNLVVLCVHGAEAKGSKLFKEKDSCMLMRKFCSFGFSRIKTKYVNKTIDS
jgi:hypothetical protein